MDCDYTNFINYVSTLTSSTLNNFKSNPNFTYVLEHVSFEYGQKYLNNILDKTSITQQQIVDYCIKNDKIGGGQKFNYEFITTSPTNFRYLYHAHLILSHLQHIQVHTTNMVEIGCGYGGLYLALDFLAPYYDITIPVYHLVDLPELSTLQQLYLSNHVYRSIPTFHSAYTYGSNIHHKNLFLVSNYCFSEILNEHQQKYIQTLFPNVSHGFMAWNHIPVYDFGFPYTSKVEDPLTVDDSHMFPLNKYVYF
jgi:hypothetical protein